MRIGIGAMVDEPDIVAVTIQRILQAAPGICADLLQQVEREIRAQYGGQRLLILKRGKRLTPEQRLAVYQDGLTSMDTTAITEKHKIGRATLYRVMKEGPRG